MNELVVVDYRTSNLLSITKALEKVGGRVVVTQDPERISGAERLVLPGVGAYGTAMHNIDNLGMREAIVDFAKTGKPLIGICLGMQLLFQVSFERGIYDGLNLIPGEVVSFSSMVKVPHMGWNQVSFERESPLFRNLRNGLYAYFVHSYYARTEPTFVIGTSNYGVKFPAVVQRDNIYGIQFHPEKSQNFGLSILKNFVELK
jgi:glutamine amidotransferase